VQIADALRGCIRTLTEDLAAEQRSGWEERHRFALESERRGKALRRLEAWASQEPTGPVPEGTREWVLLQIREALSPQPVKQEEQFVVLPEPEVVATREGVWGKSFPRPDFQIEQIEQEERRCNNSGNPCGTDTWAVGYACPCEQCPLYLEEQPKPEMCTRIRVVAGASNTVCERPALPNTNPPRCESCAKEGG
jgi:hypothetical protein